jgi:hypothetical protein
LGVALHLSSGSGCVTLLAVLFIPAAITAYFTNDPKWLVIIPLAIVAVGLTVAALPIKKKVTPEQWALQLEPHLLGTDGAFDWDGAISVRLADPRLEALRVKMSKFDSLPTRERRDEFASVITALKRGEIPEIRDDW